jgi:hypothetical protein
MRGKRHRRNKLGEIELIRRVIDRIGVDDDQGLRGSGMDVAGKRAQRVHVACGHRVDRLDVIDRGMELRIDDVTERMDLGRLAPPCQDDGATGMRFQIGCRRARKPHGLIRQRGLWHA